MELNIDIKDFECPNHSKEPVKRILRQPTAKKILFCLNCILESDTSLSNSLMTVDSLIKELHPKLLKKQDMVILSKPPDQLSEILNHEDMLISKITDQILKQKELVCERAKKIEDNIIELVRKSRDKILDELDLQLNIAKKNFDSFRTMMKKTFVQDEKTSNPLTLEDLASELNNCRTSLDFETKIRLYLAQAEESEKGQANENAIIDGLSKIKDKLKIMAEKTPTSILTTAQFEKLNSSIVSAIQPSLVPIQKISDHYHPISGSLNISSLLNQTRLNSIKSVLGITNLDLRLTEKAAKDRQNFKDIIEIATTRMGILVLMKSNENKIFGCMKAYTETIENGKVTENIEIKSFVLNTGMVMTHNNQVKTTKDFAYISPLLVIALPREDITPQYTRLIKNLSIPIKSDHHLCIAYNYLENKPALETSRMYWEKVLTPIDEIEIFETSFE